MPPANPHVQQQAYTLYVDHHAWLRAWLRQRLGNAFDAADLAQDTFLRLLAKPAPIDVQEPRALLTVIARSLVSNLYRRRRVEAAYLDTLASLPEPLTPSPEARAILLETLVEIDRRLDTLSQPVRRAFLLSQLDGMKQSEIAQTLGVSLATVQRYIATAVHQCYFGD